jgi:hypothetical protein
VCGWCVRQGCGVPASGVGASPERRCGPALGPRGDTGAAQPRMRAVAVSSLPVDGCHLTHAPGHMYVQPPLDCGFDDVDFSCVCRCSAMPGGPIEPSAYAQMKSWIVDGITEVHAERPLDGVWLELHGAMYTAGMEDCEGDLTVAVREAVGARALISASLDLHGNFSPRIASAIDMCTAFRTAPHIDEYHQLRCVCTHWGSVILTAIPGMAHAGIERSDGVHVNVWRMAPMHDRAGTRRSSRRWRCWCAACGVGSGRAWPM